MLAQAVASPKNHITTSRISDFARMNLSEFHDSKVDEDPQEFIDEVYKVVDIMGVSSKEKVVMMRMRESKRARYDGGFSYESTIVEFLSGFSYTSKACISNINLT